MYSEYGTRLPSLTPGLSRLEEPDEDDDQVDAEILKYWDAVAGEHGGDASSLFGRPGESAAKKKDKKKAAGSNASGSTGLHEQAKFEEAARAAGK